jgi:transposase
MAAKAVERDTLLDPYKPYLQQRRSQGCRDVALLHTELRQLGYRGSIRTLYRYVQPSRAQEQTTASTGGRPGPPKLRHVTTWLLRRPENLDNSEHATLAAVRCACPHLDRLGDHITAFAKMMVHRTGTGTLDNWLAAIEADDIPELHTFARGIRQDYAAVRNGLSLPYNSGACEGSVNKIKTVKRQMYGRASFALLRKRILLH